MIEITASEAKHLADVGHNEFSDECHLWLYIRAIALKGFFRIKWFEHLEAKTIERLKTLGYTVIPVRDPKTNYVHHIIEWKYIIE